MGWGSREWKHERTKKRQVNTRTVLYTGVCEIKYHLQTISRCLSSPFPQSVKVENEMRKVCECTDGTFLHSAPDMRDKLSNFDCSGDGVNGKPEYRFGDGTLFHRHRTPGNIYLCVSFSTALHPQCLCRCFRMTEPPQKRPTHMSKMMTSTRTAYYFFPPEILPRL